MNRNCKRESHTFYGKKYYKPIKNARFVSFPAENGTVNRRNSILMKRHYHDLGSTSDWVYQISHAARPIRSTSQIWVVTRHQYGISALVSQTSFDGETSCSVAKCRLFSQICPCELEQCRSCLYCDFTIPIKRMK